MTNGKSAVRLAVAMSQRRLRKAWTGTLFSSLIIWGAQAYAQPEPQQPTVKTSEGRVIGLNEGRVTTFLGIPFAQPPVGNLRWREPRAPMARHGVYDATFMRPMCTQGTPANPLGSEDCLYLNVYRPSGAVPPRRKLPVLVWIHGGGFTLGSGSAYNLASFAEKENVIAVTINYRLGAFGFLSHPALSAEVAAPRSGNYGFLDQVAALKWVQNNIAAFGGDATNVTIAGESAGGVSVYALLASPLAEGLFQKAVPQSGPFARRVGGLKEMEERGASVAAEKFGCVDVNRSSTAQPAVASCLRGLSAATILSDTFARPVIDGYFLTESMQQAFANGRFRRVPVLTGVTNDEGTFFATWADLNAVPMSKDAFSRTTERFLPYRWTDVSAIYPLEQYRTPTEAFGRMISDYAGCISLGYADDLAKFTKSYFYVWNDPKPASSAAFVQGYPPPSRVVDYRAAHALDVAYWFGLITPEELSPERQRLSSQMMGYLGNFVRTGDPNGQIEPKWPLYDNNQRTALELGYPIQVERNIYARYQCQPLRAQPLPAQWNSMTPFGF